MGWGGFLPHASNHLKILKNLSNHNRAGVVNGVVPRRILSKRRRCRQTNRRKSRRVHFILFMLTHIDGDCQGRIVFGQNDGNVENEAGVGQRGGGVQGETVVALVVVQSFDTFFVKDFQGVKRFLLIR